MILLPKHQYHQMKELILDFSTTIERVATAADRSSIHFMLEKWKSVITNL